MQEVTGSQVRRAGLARVLLGVVLSVTLATGCSPAAAQDSKPRSGIEESKVPEKRRTALGLYLSPRQAYEIMTSAQAPQVLFLDIRTPYEAIYVGTSPLIDSIVPYMNFPEFHEWDEKRGSLKIESNSKFVQLVEKRLQARGMNSKGAAIVLICRSGDRSANAVNLLAKAGYTRVYHVVEGFEGEAGGDGKRTVNGWKNAGLPWGYEITRAQFNLQ